jgi:hypothetical protein
MWILFDGGFVSIVEHREWPGRLCVRARVRADLVKFCKVAKVVNGDARIQETPEADYRFRVVLAKNVVARAMVKLVEFIDYSNFKTRVAESQGVARAHLYHDVWATLEELQKPPPI